MAIAFVSKSLAVLSAGTSVEIARGGSWALGNVIVVLVEIGSGHETQTIACSCGSNTGVEITPQKKWPTITGKMAAFTVVDDGSSKVKVTWEGASLEYQAQAFEYSGVSTTSPINATSVWTERSGSSKSMECPSITTTAANCMIVSFGEETVGSAATPPSGMTERQDNEAENPAMHLADVAQATAGASGAKTFTLTTASSDDFVLTFALAPASESKTVALKGALSSSSTLAGKLTRTRLLKGALSSSSTLTGKLETSHGGKTVSLAGSITSPSTLSGKLTRTAVLKGALSSPSSLAGGLKLTRLLSGALSSLSQLTGRLTVEGETSAPHIFLKRVHRPSRLSVIVKAPDGSPITRWAQDEPNLENVFSGLTFSGEMPGGHKELTLRLARDPKRSYRDLALFNRIEVWSSDGERVWCGTIRQEPTSDGDQQSIEVKAAGDMQFLEDDPTIIGPGFISSDMSKFGDPSTARRTEDATVQFQNAQVSMAPAGGALASPTPAAVVHAWSSMNNHGGSKPDVAESWWNGGGPEIGVIIAEFDPAKGIASEAPWNNRVYAFAGDNFASGGEQLNDFNGTAGVTATEGNFGSVVAPGRTFVCLQDYYEAAIEQEANWEAQWRNLKILGRQWLQLQGEWPNVGLLAKQMIPFIAALAGLTINPELLEDDGFVIPQAWFSSPGTPMSKLVEVTKYGLLDWFVFGDRILQYRFPGTYGRTWRLGPGNGPKNSGADAGQVYNRFMVTWQDVDGTAKSVGYRGSDALYETAALEDTDVSNPANAAGIPRGKLIALNGVCTSQLALEVGVRVIEELQNVAQSGEVTLTDHVQDEASGAWYPVSYVQPGDRVREQSNGHERKVTSTRYTDESVSNALTIGAPPNGEKAIEERFNARLIELGFGG